jgi:hypothetical protein
MFQHAAMPNWAGANGVPSRETNNGVIIREGG